MQCSKRYQSAVATIAVVALAIGVAGCGSSAEQQQRGGQEPVRRTVAPRRNHCQAAIEGGAAHTSRGPNPTIASYIQQSDITETPVHRGDPGAPTINLPIPDGWADAGPDTPAAAYWAIVDNGPEAAKYTPSIVATVSKLVGNVDQQKLLDLAAGDLKNLPGFKQGDDTRPLPCQFSRLAIGRHLDAGGQTKAIAQKTVVIPGMSVYLLQLSADCLRSNRESAARNHDDRRQGDDRVG